MLLRLLLPLVVLLVLVASSSSLFIPQAISSNMVLQRGPQSARLWGWAAAGSTVSVSLDSTGYKVLAQADGSWTVDFPPQQASTNRSVLIEGDGESVQLLNVAFGDVYICSGQSNMEFSVNDSFDGPTAVPDSINYPHLRLFGVQKKASLSPLNDTQNRWTDGEQWVVSQPKYVGGPSFDYYSATCYYFGRAVYQAVNQEGGAVVPIGLIDTCWGGTRIEAWTTPSGLEQCGPVQSNDDYYRSTADSAATRPSKRAESMRSEDAGMQRRMSGLWKRGAAAVSEAVKDDPDPQTPSVLFNGMIAPIGQMRVRGATWYQGEANAGNATNYACRFPAMIEDWRAQLNNYELYFYFVLLAAFKEGGFPGWPLIRDAQLAALQLPYVGVSSAQDLGDEASPQGSIHPRNKTIVGERLAVNALHDIYGQDIVYQGPQPSEIVWPTAGQPTQTVIMRFDSSLARNRGLTLLPTGGCDVCCNAVNGSAFTVATSSKQYLRASVVVAADTVLASVSGLPSGDSVVSVQHNWENYPQCALYNAERIPLLPLNTAKP